MASSSNTAGAFDALMPFASTFVASSSRTKLLPYHIFINHCGQDTKKTLATDIYNSLDATGLRVFLDKPELKLGDLLPKALEEAMASASICIAIFSEHYAQSTWCLAELEYMVKTGKTIIPIFYRVEPSDLRWAIKGNGRYAEAFRNYATKDRYAPEVLQRWKEALQQVSCCIGSIVNNIDDKHRAVKNVVNRVMKEMNAVPLEVAKHPVGLDEVVQDFNTIALQSAGSTQMVGIWGMGGSGKTTLAKEIFNKRSSAMDRSSFLFDLRDAAAKGILVEKQKRLLEDLKVKHAPFDRVEKGKRILNSSLRSVPVLIVLDDVDHIDQIAALLPQKESLGDRSLIIVTTRSLNVLQQWGISAIYQMRPLNDTHAKQLFCWHAFLHHSPPSEFKDLVGKFLNACQGLPLSLKVLGGQLYGKTDKEYWQRTFNKFSQIPHEDIAKRLKVSYDALGKQDKEMFLDVACFFIGQRKSAAIAAWDAEGNWDGLLRWETLFNKCLVEEDEDGLIRMHDHLRDLGRDIANAQSPYRLWSPQQVIEITPQQEAIQVRGMVNAVGDNCYQQQGKIIIHTSQGERSRAPDSLGLKIFVGDADFLNRELSRDLIWLECNKFKHKSLSPWLLLKNLGILELSDLKSLECLWEQDADAPSLLKELVIRGCHKLEKLESLKHLKLLEELVISGCRKLEALASLPETSSLKKIRLEKCRRLENVTGLENIRSLQNLKIYDCSKLDGLPSLAKLTSLKKIDLHGCGKLEKIDSLENMRSLQELKIIDCPELRALASLPGTIYLKKIRLKECHKLEKIEGLENIRSLEKLKIYDCPELNGLPGLAQLTSLKEFDLTSCDKLEKIEDLENIKSLEQFIISDCQELEALPSLPEITCQKQFDLSDCDKLKNINSLANIRSLKKLRIHHCSEIEGLPCLNSLKEFDLTFCFELKKIGGLENMRSLKKLNISCCFKLNGLPGLAQLTSLKELNLLNCHKLEKIEDLENIRSLEELIICDCRELDGLPCLAELTSLKKIHLLYCPKLKKIGGLENMRSLEKLKIHDCSELDGLSSLAGLTSLKEFQLTSCKKLEKIEGLENIRSLEKLKFSYCVIHILSLKELTSMKELELWECHELVDLPGLAELASLKEFELCKCDKLEKIEGLGNLRSLEMLRIYGCPQLEKIEIWKHMKSSEELQISDCSELEALPSFSEISSLKELELERCYKLKKIEGLENINSLERLKISDCSELEALPSFSEISSLKELKLERCYKLKKIEGLENINSLEKLIISDCSELEALPEITFLKELQLEKWHKLEKIEVIKNMRSLERLNISDCSELEALPSISEISSLKELQLKRCYKLKKVEGLERLGSLEKLEVHTCWDEPCIVSLEHPQRLESLEVVANDISAVEPFVSNLQKWPSKLMICTRAVCDVGSFKSFFSKLPDVTVHDYSDVEVDNYRGEGLKLKWPARSFGYADAILRCFIIDSDHPDLRFSTELRSIDDFNYELGKGKWVWMGDCRRGWLKDDNISARNSEGEDVKVKVEAAWFVTGEEWSMVKAFRKLFKRWPELQEARSTV